MEGRLRSLLLGCFYFLIALTSANINASELEVEQVTKPIIQPDIERLEFQESKINPDNFEVILSFGLLSIEDFSTSSVIGAKFAYRVSENFFTDIEFGFSSAGKTSIEVLLPSTPILSSDERDFTYYLINVGYDLFPGESFVSDNTTFNTALYVIAGAGNTEFAGRDNFTFSWGFGYRVVTNNYLTVYADVRDHTFEIDLFGEDKRTHNMEISFGVGFYF